VALFLVLLAAAVIPMAAASDPPSLRLKPLGEAEIAAARKNAAGSGPTLAGIHRDISAAMKKGKWQKLPGSSAAVWRVRVQSMGAHALRFHIVNFKEVGATLRIEAGREKIAPLRGDPSNTELWTDLVFGDTADITYEPAAGTKGKGKPPFVIDKLSHQFPPAGR
jgi:hypothetical protein